MQFYCMVFKFIITFFLFYQSGNAQQCYTLEVPQLWHDLNHDFGKIKIVGTKEQIIKYLKERSPYRNKCDLLLWAPKDFESIMIPTKCEGTGLNIKVEKEKDIFKLHDEIKNEDPESEFEVCINSKGEIAVSIKSKYGAIGVSSSGKFTLTSKSGDKKEQSISFP